MVSPDVLEMLLVDAVVEHQLQGFGADSFVPIRLSYPVAHLAVVFSNWDVAGFMGVVADAADSLVGLFQDNRPCGVIILSPDFPLQTYAPAILPVVPRQGLRRT